jgi:hypothetical protein
MVDEAEHPPRTRTRRWIVAGVIAAVVIVLLLAGVAIVAAGRLAQRLDRDGDDRADAQEACLTLESRLNRLVPPGATTGPASRAVAIRDENLAVRLFLTDLERADRDEWSDWWRELLDARTAYAEALNRQTRTNEPAFFTPPRTRLDGRADRRVPDACRAAVRRLAAPDL